jgi:hypothetical protein
MFKPQPNPPGTVDVDEHERRLTESADALEKRGLELLVSDGRIQVATGNQCLTSAIKARAAASQLAHARIERDHNNWLLAEAKKLQGNSERRPRLKLHRKDS